jgi:hypothetical protein
MVPLVCKEFISGRYRPVSKVVINVVLRKVGPVAVAKSKGKSQKAK